MKEADMIDRYSKIVLTVIAAALCALVLQNATTPAEAVGRDCGERFDPCYVKVQGSVSVKPLD